MTQPYEEAYQCKIKPTFFFFFLGAKCINLEQNKRITKRVLRLWGSPLYKRDVIITSSYKSLFDFTLKQ